MRVQNFDFKEAFSSCDFQLSQVEVDDWREFQYLFDAANADAQSEKAIILIQRLPFVLRYFASIYIDKFSDSPIWNYAFRVDNLPKEVLTTIKVLASYNIVDILPGKDLNYAARQANLLDMHLETPPCQMEFIEKEGFSGFLFPDAQYFIFSPNALDTPDLSYPQ